MYSDLADLRVTGAGRDDIVVSHCCFFWQLDFFIRYMSISSCVNQCVVRFPRKLSLFVACMQSREVLQL